MNLWKDLLNALEEQKKHAIQPKYVCWECGYTFRHPSQPCLNALCGHNAPQSITKDTPHEKPQETV